MELSPQQADAVQKITAWYERPDQVFRLFGFAGTGKTSLAKHIVGHLGVEAVLYAAYTGKAAYVLRMKDCEDASTVHSLIYSPVDKLRAKLYALRKQLEEETDPAERLLLERQIAREEDRLGQPDFVLREDSELSSANLLVLDEVSMIGERTAADLLSFGCKVLCLGDPAQLPPVDGGGYFINAEPDHLLTEIHRSALDSPVTRMATTVRNSTPGVYGYGIDGPDGDSGRIEKTTVDDLMSYGQVLVGTNKTRWQMIHLLRTLAGRITPLPVPGDRVIVLANSAEANVFNGQQFVVSSAAPVPGKDDRLLLEVAGDDGTERVLTAWARGFTGGAEGEKAAKRDGRGDVVAATYAQAITCHKSQGSQWDSVLVVDESGVFSRAAARENARRGRDVARAEGHLAGRRWLYTAITRAAQRAVIVPGVTGLLAAR